MTFAPLSPEWWAAFTQRDRTLPGEVIPGTHGYRRVAAADYHAFPAVNNGLLKCRTAAEMFAKITTPEEDTDAMTIGTLVHMASLEPETSWAERFALAEIPINPKTDKPYGRDTNRGEAAWAAAAEAHPGKIVVTEETLKEYLGTCRELQLAIAANPDAMHELADVHSEVTGFLWHPRWQCWVKWRPDILPRHLRYLADIKTSSRHPADFAKDAWQYGYFLQAVWYTELHEMLTARLGLHVSKFSFIVVSKSDDSKYPRPAMCRVADVPMDPALSKGVELAKKALGLPEGFSRVDVFLDCLRQYVEAGCPHPTTTNFRLIRSIWPAFENEAGEKGGRWVLAD